MYRTYEDLLDALEDTRDTVKECIHNGDSYAYPIEIATNFLQEHWAQVEEWLLEQYEASD